MSDTQKPTEPKYSLPSDTARKVTAANRWRVVRYVAMTFACLIFMAGGTLIGIMWRTPALRPQIGNLPGVFVNTVLHGDPTLNWTPGRQYPDRNSLNLLILGVDHDYDDRDQIVRSSFGRSDSIMIARIDFVAKTIDALTIPRDSAVHIPGHTGIHKINAAHNFGGPALTEETVQQVFGIPTDACVVLNFEGFQQIVDALGGIDVNVAKKLDYDDNWGNLHIHLKPGYQHLNGYQAMGFVRMRHSDSDEMRSKRQHEFLEAMRAKVKQTATLARMPTVIQKLSDNLKRVSITDDQLLALVNFARTLPKENIHVETLPSDEGPSYVTINAEKSAEVIQRMFFPNQAVALNVDAPDPNAVRSMNAPYERGGGGRHKKHGRGKAGEGKGKPTVPAGGLSVEPDAAPAPDSKPDSAPSTTPADPPKPDTDSGKG